MKPKCLSCIHIRYDTKNKVYCELDIELKPLCVNRDYPTIDRYERDNDFIPKMAKVLNITSKELS
jgi:hypothetical protein